MGRRSVHTAEELRELILTASTDLIISSGFSGLSAREIARRIEYSPGTLYNVFENLDDLVLTIEGRLLDALAKALAEVQPNADAAEHVRQLAARYFAFTQEQPKLWNLLFEHHLPAGKSVPPWYQQKLEGLMSEVEQALAPLMTGESEAERKRSARVLWAGVHGITSLATAEKLAVISMETAGSMLDELVTTYLAGLRAKTPGASPGSDDTSASEKV